MSDDETNLEENVRRLRVGQVEWIKREERREIYMAVVNAMIRYRPPEFSPFSSGQFFPGGVVWNEAEVLKRAEEVYQGMIKFCGEGE